MAGDDDKLGFVGVRKEEKNISFEYLDE